MIIAIIGMPGSGKTISAIRYIYNRRNVSFTNFHTKLPHKRLKVSHIISVDEEKTKTGKTITKKKVNYTYWKQKLKEHGGYDIYLDEAHNFIHARRAMSGWNTHASIWVSQIRKILGGKENHHLFLISQRITRLDLAFRDLVDHIIYCQKIDLPGDKKVILQYHFVGETSRERFDAFLYSRESKLANIIEFFDPAPFYGLYDSHEFVDFGNNIYA